MCPACGFANPLEFRFCGACGASLERQPAPSAATGSAPERPQPERRQLTVLFCDLVGSSMLASRLDPEELRDVILAYQTACTSAIRRFDGTVSRYVGDAILALFGYPRAHEDDAERAVRAGLDIVSVMATLPTPGGGADPLAARIGIATGIVVVGDLIGEGAAEEQAVMGETPNLAARLQGLASPNSVVIAPSTRALLGEHFDCADLGTHALHGFGDVVRAWRVLASKFAGSRFEAAQPLRVTALINREEEMAWLLRLWQDAERSCGRVGLLAGEAGIGKSRVVEALREQIAPAPDAAQRFQCSPHYVNTALHPIIERIERSAGIGREDTPAVKLEKLSAWLGTGFPTEDAVPLLGALLSVPPGERFPLPAMSPQRRKERTFELLLGLIQRLASSPLLMVFEDVYWMDPTTQEFLALLVERASEMRVLLVITFRRDFSPPWSDQPHVESRELKRLAPDYAIALAERVAGEQLPGSVIDQVVAKTDGVPLFIEELTKAVLGARFPPEQLSRGTLAAAAGLTAIPSTLQDSLMARLDQLDKAKGLAQLAAVIGREFSYKLIHAVSQQDERELRESLSRVVDAELLYQRGLPPNALYSFKHALIQDAAYQSLLKTKRAEYHRQTAAALVENFPDVVDSRPELVAQHYEEAGMVEQAITYWQRAGARALEASADLEAVAHLRRALAQIAALPQTENRVARETACLLSLGAALAAIRGYASGEVEQTYERAMSLCERSGDTDRLFTALTGLTSFYQVRGPLVTARRICERLLELARQRDDKIWLAQAHRRLGWCLFCQGQLIPGREHLEHALRLYDRLRSHEHTRVHGAHPWVIGSVNSALLEWYAGYPDDAVIRSREGLSHARELDRPLTLAYALCMSAAVHQCRGESQPTLELAREVVALAKEHDFPYWIAWGSVLEGWALATSGQVDEGVSRMHSGLAMYRDTGALLFEPSSLALLAEVYWHAGRIEEALDCTSRALESPEMLDGYFCSADIHRLKGELLLARDADEPTAEGCFLEALKIAREQGARSLELRCAVSLGELRKRQGREEDCRALVQGTLDRFDQGFDTPDMKRAMKLLSIH